MATRRVIKRRTPPVQKQKSVAKTSKKKAVKKASAAKTPAAKSSKKFQPKKVEIKSSKSNPKKSEHVKTNWEKNQKETESKNEKNWTGVAILAGFLIIAVAVGFALWHAPEPTPTTTEPELPTEYIYAPEDVMVFEQVYEHIITLDKEYVTDYHQERLGKDMINPIFIKPYVEKIDLMWAAVNESQSNETQINSQFLEARRRMLLSQAYFQQALKFGELGVVREINPCSNLKDLATATMLYNKSVEVGRFAIPRLDYVLTKSGYAREKLGVNLEKPRWYVTTFGDILRLVETNSWAINEFCPLRQSLNSSVGFKKQPTVDTPDLPGIKVTTS